MCKGYNCYLGILALYSNMPDKFSLNRGQCPFMHSGLSGKGTSINYEVSLMEEKTYGQSMWMLEFGVYKHS